MASERIIVGIDVGTTKVCTLISSVTDEDQLEIIGAGVTASRGLRKGVVVNVEEAMEAIDASVSKAEQQSGFKIVSAYVGISGAHTQSANGEGVVAVRRGDHQITDEDVSRVLEAAKTITLAPEREIIHIIPRHYIVDGQEGITNPVTMVGHRLEVETTIVSGMVNAIHNLTRCIERLDIGIDELVLQSLAAGDAVLTPAEKDLGVALIDLGGGTSDLAVYQDGAVAFATSLPIGGSHISNDIAVGLRTPLAAAEEIKIRHGHAVIDSVEEGKTIDVAAFDTGEGRPISRRLLNSIIADRLTETFELLYEQLRRAGYTDPLPAGIVLAGGTAQLPGIRRVAAEVFQSPIRVGTPSGMFGLVDSVATPAFATSVGLLKWGLTQMDEHGYNGSGGLGNSLGAGRTMAEGLFPIEQHNMDSGLGIEHLLEARVDGQLDGSARIVVIGVGGGGSNAVNRMIQAGVRGVEFVTVNTDAQALARSESPVRLRIGEKLTRGLGAGGQPSMGARAAEESAELVQDVCRGADMVFIAAGMGGGTGTGASPVIASLAQECGALVVGVVTKPFTFEGARRRNAADDGIQKLKSRVNTLITIPNDRLLQIIDKKTSLEQAFGVVDDVLRQGIQGISELITEPGLVNLDFADVKTIMSEAGSALMAIGRGAGETRAADAARMAISSPLLDVSMEGARGVLFNITGGADLTLSEIQDAADIIGKAADPEANIIFGAVIDQTLGNEVKITVIATGFDTDTLTSRSTESTRERARDREGDPERGRSRPQTLLSDSLAADRDPAEYAQLADVEDDLDLPPWVRRNRQR